MFIYYSIHWFAGNQDINNITREYQSCTVKNPKKVKAVLYLISMNPLKKPNIVARAKVTSPGLMSKLIKEHIRLRDYH